jgi:uncharacterized protein YjbI with pentapeptide repeats
LAGLDLSSKDLTGYNLEGNDLRSFKFANATLDRVDLAGADLRGTSFDHASLAGADLRGAKMDTNTFLGSANLSGANLSGVAFAGANLAFTDLRGANLTGATFNGVKSFNSANLAGETLANLVFRGVSFVGADLSGCNLTGADLSRGFLSLANLQNVIWTGANLEGTSGVLARGQDLRTVNLRGVNVSDFAGSNLSGDDLSVSRLSAAALNGANLSNCNLTGLIADFIINPFGDASQGKMSQSNFRNADLTGASFRNCDLLNCDFTGATLTFADFTGANLTGSVAFDAEQPGMQFGPRAGFGPPGTPPTQNGTALPDGTLRNGTNPGNPLAPPTLPHLRLNIDDGGVKSTVDLSLNGTLNSPRPGDPLVFGGQFSSLPNGTPEGTFQYANKTVTTTLLLYTGGPTKGYTLLFTSPSGGQLFQNVSANSDAGVWLIGTFQVL